MNIITYIFFSTLVFSVATAAQVESSAIKQRQTEESFSGSIDNYTITAPKPVPSYEKPKPLFSYTADKSIFLHVSQFTFWRESATYRPFGFTFSDYNRNMDSKEYGFDVKHNLGRAFYGKKYFFNTTGAFRSYYKWDIGLNIDPDDGLANLVNFKKYMLGGGIGGEVSYSKSSGFRYEGKILFSRDDTILQFSLGYVYSW